MAEPREGVPEDAGALAQFFLDSAVPGFSPFLPPDYQWPSAADLEERTREMISTEGVGLFVAEGPDGLLGYAGHSASRDPDALPGVGEVRTMFVHPSAYGTGVAGALLTRVLEQLRADGYEEATVWSFVANERANAFYEKHGMTRDGARRREAVWADLDQVRYRMSLAGAVSAH